MFTERIEKDLKDHDPNDIVRKGMAPILRGIVGIRVEEQASFGELDILISDIFGYMLLTHLKKLEGICAKSKPKGILICVDNMQIDFDLPFIVVDRIIGFP